MHSDGGSVLVDIYKFLFPFDSFAIRYSMKSPSMQDR